MSGGTAGLCGTRVFSCEAGSFLPSSYGCTRSDLIRSDHCAYHRNIQACGLLGYPVFEHDTYFKMLLVLMRKLDKLNALERYKIAPLVGFPRVGSRTQCLLDVPSRFSVSKIKMSKQTAVERRHHSPDTHPINLFHNLFAADYSLTHFLLQEPKSHHLWDPNARLANISLYRRKASPAVFQYLADQHCQAVAKRSTDRAHSHSPMDDRRRRHLVIFRST